jgi:hypothetical protein
VYDWIEHVVPEGGTDADIGLSMNVLPNLHGMDAPAQSYLQQSGDTFVALYEKFKKDCRTKSDEAKVS